MEKYIEREINCILQSDYSVDVKIKKIEVLIRNVSSEMLRKRLYLAVSRYLWLGKIETFFINELLKPDGNVVNKVDASELWLSKVVSRKGAKLIAASAKALRKALSRDKSSGKLDELYSILEFNMEIGPHSEGNYTVNDDDFSRNFDCTIDHDSPKTIKIKVAEERLNKLNGNVERYVTDIVAKYEGNKCITECILRTKPDEVGSRSIYEETKLVKEEWCDGESNTKDTYTSDEASIISDLGLLDMKSPIFQRAIRDAVPVASKSYYGHDNVERHFSKSNGKFEYCICFSKDDKKSAIIKGNLENAEIEYRLSKKTISSDEFVRGKEDSTALQQFQDTIIKLQEYGVYVEGFESESSDSIGCSSYKTKTSNK